MKVTEAVLAALDAAPDKKIDGRTQLQKVIYLAGAIAGVQLPYRAHYYGPYSRDVAAEVDSLVASDVVDEAVSKYGGSSTHERRLHKYTLADGADAVVKAVAADCAEWKPFQAAVRRVCRLDRGYQPLSLAAKIHWLLSEAGAPIALTDARQMAAELSWDLEQADVDTAVEILTELDLVTVVDLEA